MNDMTKVRIGTNVQSDMSTVVLTSSQKNAYERVQFLARHSPVVALNGNGGLGKTTILAKLAADMDGTLLTLDDVVTFVAPLEGRWYLSSLLEWLRARLQASKLLLLDDLVTFLNYGRAGRHQSPLGMYMILEQLYRDAEAQGKPLILGASLREDQALHGVLHRPDLAVASIPAFTHEDYAQLAAVAMGNEKSAGIDFRQIFRFASLLNGHDLKSVASILSNEEKPTTEEFMDAIQEFVVSANTDTREVEDVRFETMPGMEAIARQLDAHVVTPLTDMALAEKLDLKAKRGVLLYGPPGTGKTSVGRALAHRLKGRFFLIDGSVKTEPAWTFLSRVQAIVNEAIENAPSVIFIDDADVLFDVEHVAGLTRYLLTLLDGLAGTNASKVCVMMTAMDPGKIPQAILRSGRVELWLETKLPDQATRGGILKRWLGEGLPLFAEVDQARLGGLTDRFTPADLRRVAADARALYAMDRVTQSPLATGTDYAERAIADMVASRNAMATNLADPSLRVG